jgi:xanthine dehydrogenase accessory factor
MDVFVEPVLPQPQVVICGSSPVAVAIADLGRRVGFAVTVCAPLQEQAAFGEVDRRVDGYSLPDAAGSRFIVVSIQGRGDEAALHAALTADAEYVAFVGSRKKAAALKTALGKRGIGPERFAQLHAPAGLDFGAITPDEIAASILAEIIAARRGNQRSSIKK